MSVFVGTYKVSKRKYEDWMRIRRQKAILGNGEAPLATIRDAYMVHKESDDSYQEVYRMVEKDVMKLGFDMRRNDSISYGFPYLKDDEILVWMDKGDDEVPGNKPGFSKT